MRRPLVKLWTERYPALVGFIDQLPDASEGWTPERRGQWLTAFTLVLDLSLPLAHMEDIDVTPDASLPPSSIDSTTKGGT